MRAGGRRSDLRLLGFKLETRGRETVEAAPDEAIDGDNHGRHDYGGTEEEVEIAGVGGAADDCAEADGRKRLPPEMKVFCHNTGIPRAAGSRHEPSNQERKDSRQQKVAPTFVAAEMEDVADLL